MLNYQHILVAIDLSTESKKIIKKAIDTAADSTQVTVLHVMPAVDSTFGIMPYGGPVMINSKEFTEKMLEVKNAQLNDLMKEFEHRDISSLVQTGKPAKVIKSFAEELICDLIVMGSHGQHGMQLLLGSTANAVLHDAPCDVLTVRCFR